METIVSDYAGGSDCLAVFSGKLLCIQMLTLPDQEQIILYVFRFGLRRERREYRFLHV